MIHPRLYISALQASWIKRAYLQPFDFWSLTIYYHSKANPLTISGENLRDTIILKNLAAEFSKLVKNFSETEKNIQEAYLINNLAVTRSLIDKKPLDKNCFQELDHISLLLLAKVRVKDICSAEFRLKDNNSILLNTGIEFTLNARLRLESAVHTLRQKYSNKAGGAKKIETFLIGFKKGSKNIRKHLAAPEKIALHQQFRKYSQLTGTRIPDINLLKKTISMWSKHYLPNTVKDFSFKFFNNLLGINTRVSHFNNEVERGCTFCKLDNKLPVPDETFVHLFFECRSGPYQLINRFFDEQLPELNLAGDEIKKQSLFFFNTPTNKHVPFLGVLFTLLLQYIWKSKLNKTRLSYIALLTHLKTNILPVIKVSGEIKSSMTNTDTVFVRSLDHERHGRG